MLWGDGLCWGPLLISMPEFPKYDLDALPWDCRSLDVLTAPPIYSWSEILPSRSDEWLLSSGLLLSDYWGTLQGWSAIRWFLGLTRRKTESSWHRQNQSIWVFLSIWGLRRTPLLSVRPMSPAQRSAFSIVINRFIYRMQWTHKRDPFGRSSNKSKIILSKNYLEWFASRANLYIFRDILIVRLFL